MKLKPNGIVISEGDIVTAEHLPAKMIEQCGAAGVSCDEAVDYWYKKFDVLVNPDKLRTYLHSIGAWDKEDLEDHVDNLHRLIWLMCCDIREHGEFIFDA